MINKDELTIVFQGPVYPTTYEYMERYKNLGYEVIASTWSPMNIPYKVIINSYEEADKLVKYFGGTSMNGRYQVYSTLMGLNEVKTKYAIKHRSDEYYTLDNLINLFEKDTSKIVFHNIFYRTSEFESYHISDKLQIGETKNLKIMYQTAFDFLNNLIEIDFHPKCTESLLGASYLKACNFSGDEETGMKKYFDFINIDELAPFNIKFNQQTKKDFNEHNFDFETLKFPNHHIKWKI